jgi:hypothetical protein
MRYHAAQQYVWKGWLALKPDIDPEDDIKNPWKYRYSCIPAGRRSGKTELLKRGGILRSFLPRPWEDPRILFGAPTYQQAKRIFWRDLKMMVPKDFVKHISESELFIRLKTGAELWVAGLDKPERFEGISWDGMGITEYANIKETALPENIRPALADRQGWLWVEGVPEGRNHYWDLWCRSQENPSWLTAHWKSEEILPEDEITELKKELDARTYRQEMEASFEEAVGQIYYAFSRKKHPNGNLSIFKPPENIGTDSLPWRVGMDFNVHPMTSVLGWQTLDTIFVYKEYVVDGSNTEEVAEIITDDITRHNPEQILRYVYPDPTGRRQQTSAGRNVTDHTILRNKGFRLNAHLDSPRRKNRYAAVNTRLRSGDGRRRLVIHADNCPHLLKCLGGQVFPENRSEEHPNDPLGHINAALGYWVEYEFPVQSVISEVQSAKF